ncbi:DUF86 domain-containing protein [Paenibacillus daejeonensis]|uniref:DUF86 domain-containing protein n=1 Tax=Paenibacillus daejeonensis TaxID=135193 RepID=UPI00035CFBD9|nr:HepT-like ribonuclease domain-containing protein [Paenibacillus daejeonensis]
MYYVDRKQIEARLHAMPALAQGMQALASDWQGSLLQGLAQERALHLAVESVTDIGSYLIDAFIMRDASSYEDILDIIHGEGVYPGELHETLIELVKLRKPLVQQYYEWPREELHALTPVLPSILLSFATAIEDYMAREASN